MASVHGGSPWATRPTAAEDALAGQGLRPRGHRHFLRTPGEAERSRLFCAEADREAQVAMLRRLSRAMRPPDDRLAENPLIPSGYTYLLQLAAQDWANTPTPLRQHFLGQAEARHQRLGFDTVHGGGFSGCPHASAPDDEAGNPLVAQMAVLWHLLHNSLMDIAGLTAGPAAQEQARVFAWARAATTLTYRRILKKDALRRLLDPAIYERYMKAASVDLLDRDPDPDGLGLTVPLEFSHGAMRFAHAMVRPGDDITETFAHGIEEARPRGWMAQWSRFFEVPGEDGARATLPRNLSLRIRPSYAQPSQDSAPSAGPATGPGLALRDMMSAGAARLWSVSALHAAIVARARELERPWIAPFGDLDLAWDTARTRAVATWLAEHADPLDPFGEAELRELSTDPPLPFYVQFEAWKRHEGYRLGPLGSILVAEAMFGAMLADPLPGETADGPLACSLLDLAATLGLTIRRPADLPEVDDMGGLIRFVAHVQGRRMADHRPFA